MTSRDGLAGLVARNGARRIELDLSPASCRPRGLHRPRGTRLGRRPRRDRPGGPRANPRRSGHRAYRTAFPCTGRGLTPPRSCTSARPRHRTGSGRHPLPPACRGCTHPQHLAPEATACALAASPQHPPDSCASASVPQHVLAASSPVEAVVVAGLPQQPPAEAGGANASAGSPANPPVTEASLHPEHAVDLARMFKALGDPIRLRLLSRITSTPDGEICVCDITGGDFDVSGPTISHHLKVLREAGLINSERRGTWVYYRPVPANLRQLAALLDTPVRTKYLTRDASGSRP